MPMLSAVLSALVQLFPKFSLLIFFTLIPLFSSLLKAKTQKAYFKATAVFSLCYYLIQFSFLITVYDFLPFSNRLSVILALLVIIILSVWETIWLCLCLFWGYFFKGTFSRVFAASLLFVLGEHLQEHNPLFTFCWSKTENTLAYFPELIQTASVFGGSFVAFIILSVSGLITIFLLKSPKITAADRYFSAFFALLIFISNYAFGVFRINNYPQNGEQTDALIIQTSVLGEEKYDLTAEKAAEDCIRLIEKNITETTDLVLLPETAIPEYLNKSHIFSCLSQLAQQTGAVIVTGCFSQENENLYNSLAAIEPDGTISKTYNKSFLIPFGEYAPFLKNLFHFRNISPCSESSPLQTSLGKLGGVICVESILSDVSTSQTRDGCSLLLVSTNDSWFGESLGRNAHFTHSIMRAVECDKYLLRSGNCGISAVISPTGKILSSDFSKDPGAISAVIRTNPYPSVYSKIGDIIIIPALFITGLGIVRFLLGSKLFKAKKSGGK